MVTRTHLFRLHLSFKAGLLVSVWFPARRGQSDPRGSPAFGRPRWNAVGLQVDAGKDEGSGGAVAVSVAVI